MNWLSAILGKTPEIVGNYFTEKLRLKAEEKRRDFERQEAVHKRQCDLISHGLAADATWEMEHCRQAANGLKDEYVLGIVSIPAVLCFIQTAEINGPEIVRNGMAALDGTPLWYQIILGSILLSTIGVRWWRRSQTDT